MDPFAQFDHVDGLSQRLEGVVRELSLKSRPKLPFVHALLAYADKPGVREKFDERFGDGAAEAVIAKASKDDAIVALRTAVEVLTTRMQEITGLSERLDNLTAAVAAVPPADLQPVVAKLDSVIAAVTKRPEPAGVPAPPVDTSAIVTLTRAVEALNRLQRAKRTVERDVNGNVIGLKIED